MLPVDAALADAGDTGVAEDLAVERGHRRVDARAQPGSDELHQHRLGNVAVELEGDGVHARGREIGDREGADAARTRRQTDRGALVMVWGLGPRDSGLGARGPGLGSEP